MAFISEIHFHDSYDPAVPGNPPESPTSTEYTEVAMNASEAQRAGDFTLSFYNSDGTLINEVNLGTITPEIDPDSGLYVYRVDQLMSQPDADLAGVAEAVALVENSSVVTFYDIAGGTEGIVANGGAADGAQSTTIGGTGSATNRTIQFDNEGNRFGGFATPGRAVCFTAGTLIETPVGQVPIDLLNVGDLVVTRDHGNQPLRWIGGRRLSPAELANAPNLAPILIRSSTLGTNIPTDDLTVSPQHRILIRSKIAERMFGQDEVLVAAKQLLTVEGIEQQPINKSVIYYHMACSQHEIVFANGVEAETLYPGPEALQSVPATSVAELLAIFPELMTERVAKPARIFVKGRDARQLAFRHVKNGKPLVNRFHSVD